MSDDIIKYYERYKTVYGEQAYNMTKNRNTSRVRYLQSYIKKYVPAGGKVLDLGCGDMYLSTIMPGYDWVGMDIAPDMSNNKAVKHDIMTFPYPFKDGEFDAIVCSEVLEHVWYPRQVHQEVKRILKPQGTYILSTPNYDHIDFMLTNYRDLLFDDTRSHLIEHIRQYNREVHTKMLNETGFSVSETMGADAHFSKFFEQARGTLFAFVNESLKLNMGLGQVDQLLGAMFPDHSHTIILVSKPTN